MNFVLQAYELPRPLSMTHMTNTIALMALTLLSGLTEMQAGTIVGIVQTPEGSPLSSATVVAARRFSAVSTSAPVLAFASTDHNGYYHFDSLVDGSYVVCAQLPWMAYLDPCSWDAAPPVWNLDSSHPGVIRIILRRGVFFNIQVDDPAGAVLAQAAKTHGPVYRFHVLDKRGIAHWIQPSPQDASGKSLRTVIPAGEDVFIVAHLGAIALSDAAGNALPDGGKFTVHAATLGDEQTKQFTAKVGGQ
jgi:hypothetical protein